MPTLSESHVLQPPAAIAPNLAGEFALDPSIDFLNHGSFGARPRAILEAQTRRRMEFEARPIEWLDRRRHDLILEAKRVIGRFLGMTPANFGFVTNATGGINAVLRSLTFKPGDELLTTTHVYNAVRQTMRYLAERAGAKYVEIDIPLPLRSSDEIVERIAGAITPRTRIALIDHITSPTAVIFPIERIIELCQQRGVDLIIDGAHAPGMIDLNVEHLSSPYYAANLHKWVCAPPGSAFLWAPPDRQQGIHPTTISHFCGESFVAEFNWQGTRDITPWLCAADAIEWFERLGWERVMRHNHQMAVWVQAMLCAKWQVEPATPLDGSMLGSMATVLLPRQSHLRTKFVKPETLKAELFERHRLEVPVVDWGGKWWVRPCCQIYNQAEQYERLADAVLKLVA